MGGGGGFGGVEWVGPSRGGVGVGGGMEADMRLPDYRWRGIDGRPV